VEVDSSPADRPCGRVVIGVDGSGRTRRLRELARPYAVWLPRFASAADVDQLLQTVATERHPVVVDDAHLREGAPLVRLARAAEDGVPVPPRAAPPARAGRAATAHPPGPPGPNTPSGRPRRLCGAGQHRRCPAGRATGRRRRGPGRPPPTPGRATRPPPPRRAAPPPAVPRRRRRAGPAGRRALARPARPRAGPAARPSPPRAAGFPRPTRRRRAAARSRRTPRRPPAPPAGAALAPRGPS
jgi:hypothetical protein